MEKRISTIRPMRRLALQENPLPSAFSRRLDRTLEWLFYSSVPNCMMEKMEHTYAPPISPPHKSLLYLWVDVKYVVLVAKPSHARRNHRGDDTRKQLRVSTVCRTVPGKVCQDGGAMTDERLGRCAIGASRAGLGCSQGMSDWLQPAKHL